MCYVTIFDGSGKPITVEVSREIYQVFADYEREMERQRKEEYDSFCRLAKALGTSQSALAFRMEQLGLLETNLLYKT